MSNSLNIETHKTINRNLCGTPKKISAGESLIEMKTTKDMAVDDKGLVHGGFIFGLADHAAMLAVNHPFVVLSGTSCRFLKPAMPGQLLIAEGKIIDEDGRKKIARVTVRRENEIIFTGDFTCVVLENHVLAPVQHSS